MEYYGLVAGGEIAVDIKCWVYSVLQLGNVDTLILIVIGAYDYELVRVECGPI
uniref:Uncharacterized protein n=1 Tax=Oryza sativa subsp. japonica TaxID=39947 RepID=Q6YVM5_ORYSJ|nr:hypothetical protein [Oryza sativa Japonica Group]